MKIWILVFFLAASAGCGAESGYDGFPLGHHTIESLDRNPSTALEDLEIRY